MRDLVVAGLKRQRRRPARLPPALRLCVALIVRHARPGCCWSRSASGWPRQRARARAGDRPHIRSSRWRAPFVYFFALAPALAAIAIALLSGRLGPLDASRRWWCCRASRSIVAAGDRVLLYRERIVSLRLARPAGAAAAAGGARHRAAAVDRRRRSRDRAAGQADGPVLRRQLPAPHRQAARIRRRRSAHGAAGRARRAEPAARLFRLGAASAARGRRRRHPRTRAACMVWPAPTPAAPPPATQARSFPTGAGSAARVRARRSRACCR